MLLTLWPLGFLTVLLGVMAIVAWRQQPHRGARSFAMVAAGATWWTGSMTVGHVLDQEFGLHATFVLFTRLEWIGTFVLAISWFVFALRYTGRGEYARRRVVALLAVFPVAVYPVAFANGLIIDSAADLVGYSTDLTAAFDPWMAVEPLVVAYVYVLLAVSSFLILRYVLTSRFPHPEESILWMLAVAFPWIINALYFTGVIPPLGPAKIDPTPFGFVAFVVIGVVAITQDDAFRVAPVARAYVVDQLDTGVVVFDLDCRVVDVNEWATSMLGDAAGTRGADVRSVLETVADDGLPEIAGCADGAALAELVDGETITVEHDGAERQISIGVSVLERAADDRLQVVDGYALVLHDETERIDRERALESRNEQIELLNQIVRHDIRNDMQIAYGRATLLADHVDTAGEEHLEIVLERVDHVADLTRAVRDLSTAIASGDKNLHPTPLAETLRAEVAEVDAGFDATEVHLGEVPDVSVRANEMLGSVFRNLLHNAVQHNPGDSPMIVVWSEHGQASVLVSVADNGPGIPAEGRDRIFERGERGPSSEGSGLGLFLVGTLVDHYGGDVRVESTDALADDSGRPDAADRLVDTGGAVFRVELPKA